MKKITTLLALSLLFLIAGKPAFNDGYNVGDQAADFKLKNFDGKMVALSDYKEGKGVIVIFDCNTCPYSKAYNKRIFDLHASYAPKGYPVITINPNDPRMSPGDSYSEIVKQAKNKNYTFPYLIDESQEVARAFGASNTPHVYVLKKDGNTFKIAYIGAIDNNSRDARSADKKYVEDAIDSLLEGKEVPNTKTKAIGCTIKYRST